MLAGEARPTCPRCGTAMALFCNSTFPPCPKEQVVRSAKGCYRCFTA